MNELDSFYKDILRSFDFSITGYKSIEEKVDSYFSKLCISNFFVGRNHIDFISYVFAKLKNVESFEIEHLGSDSFFYNSFSSNSLELLLLDDYYAFKYYLDGINVETSTSIKKQSISSAEIAVQLFYNPTSYRIRCTEDGCCNVKYDQHNDLISIEIPYNYIFNSLENETFNSFKNKLFQRYSDELLKDQNPNKIIKKSTSNIYTFSSEGDTISPVKIIEYIDKDKIVNLISILKAKLTFLNSSNDDRFFGKKLNDSIIKNFSKLVISQVFSSYLFNCWVENIPAVVKVDETSNKKWCLGNVVVGYSTQDLSISERIYFRIISDRLSASLAAESVQKLIKDVSSHATRAAISQVMARNMSHNIGSHVLANMVTIDSVERKFNEKNQYQSSFEFLYGSSINDKNKTIENPSYLLANFNSYMRTRMDFLADIATGEPAMEVSRLLLRDVIGDLDRNRHLLNYISGVDDFNYSIVVKDCRKCQEDCASDNCKCNGIDKDVPISVPNGLMGYHALYIIIENIIRNTAKHQGQVIKSNEVLNSETAIRKIDKKIFNLEIRECNVDNTLYEVLIYDNVQIADHNTFSLLADDEKFYTEHTGNIYTDELNNRLDWLVFQQNCRLNTSVINAETSRLRDGAWGLIEMDVSAAYLRKQAPESVDEDIYNIELLKPESRVDAKSGKNLNILKAVKKNNHLAYRFHLMKPKELLIVDEVGDFYARLRNVVGKLSSLRENGIWVLQRYNANYEDYFEIESVYSHPFLLIIANENFNIDEYLYTNIEVLNLRKQLFRGNLPTRIISCKKDLDDSVKNHESSWYTCISFNHKLIKELEVTAPHLIKTIPEELNDLKSQTVMDIVWQIWLQHKEKYHDIKLFNEEQIEKTINRYILDEESSNNNKKKFKVYYDHHGDQKKTLTTACLKSEFGHYSCYPSAVKSFIYNARKDIIQGEFNQNFDKIGLAIITDSILTKLLIIDERIQTAWLKKYSSTNRIQHELYECSDLYSPKQDSINLSLQTYFDKDYCKQLARLIFSINQGKLKGLDYIAIHLGVIEKILTAKGYPKKKENVLEFILELQTVLKDSKTRIVITSGRGKPDNLPERVPFIAFSTLSQYTIETPFKPFLNEVIQNARQFNSK